APGTKLLGRGRGGETVKLPYGHRAGNHPGRDLATDKYLSRRRTTDSRFVAKRLAFPAPSRLRSPTLTSTTEPSKASSTGSTLFLPSSTIRRRHRGPMTPRDIFNNSYKPLTPNK